MSSPSLSTEGSSPLTHVRYSPKEWEGRRTLITRLYSVENRRLVDVCKILSEQHGFNATERSLKHRIRLWHLDKKQKDPEMRMVANLYLRRKAQGKESAFRIRGRDVDIDEIRRYFRRKGVRRLEMLSTDSAVPLPLSTDILCFTPEPELSDSPLTINNDDWTNNGDWTNKAQDISQSSDDEVELVNNTSRMAIMDPDSFGTAEVALRRRPDYLRQRSPVASLAIGLPVFIDPPADLKEMELVLSLTKLCLASNDRSMTGGSRRSTVLDPINWRNDFLQASYLFRAPHADLAFLEFEKVYDRVHNLLLSQNPVFFTVLLGLLCFPENPLDTALSQQLFRYIHNMSQMTLGEMHPITQFLKCTLTSEHTSCLAVLSLQAVIDMFERTLGHDHEQTLQAQEQVADALLDLGKYSEVVWYREKLVAAHEIIDGIESPAACWALLDLARAHVRGNRDDLATPLIEDALKRADKLPPRPQAEIRIRGLGRLAFINDRSGRPATTKMLLEKAIDLGQKHFDWQSYNDVASEQDLQNVINGWHPFFKRTKSLKFAASDSIESEDHAQKVLSKSDVIGFVSSLHTQHQGRALSLQQERFGGDTKNRSISRNLFNLMLIQSQQREQ